MDPTPLDLVSVGMALSSRTRAHMVTALAEGAMTVTELAEAMGIHQTTASYHCSLLEAAGLIVVQPSGNRRYISLRARELRVRFGPQGDTGHS